MALIFGLTLLLEFSMLLTFIWQLILLHSVHILAILLHLPGPLLLLPPPHLHLYP